MAAGQSEVLTLKTDKRQPFLSGLYESLNKNQIKECRLSGRAPGELTPPPPEHLLPVVLASPSRGPPKIYRLYHRRARECLATELEMRCRSDLNAVGTPGRKYAPWVRPQPVRTLESRREQP